MSEKTSQKNTQDKKPDRRVKRTRSALREAIVELIIEKGYDSITVADLMERADVARSTFYQHYSGKESVLTDGIRVLEEYLGGIQIASIDKGEGSSACLSFLGPLLEHVGDHRTLYKALTRDKGVVVVNTAVRRMFLRLIGREVRRARRGAASISKEVPEEALIGYVTDAFLSLMTWWMEARTERSPLDIEKIFRLLMEPSLESVGLLGD